MNTAASMLPVFAAWRLVGRPSPYIQISRWSLSLQDDPIFEKFPQRVSFVLVLGHVGCLKSTVLSVRSK